MYERLFTVPEPGKAEGDKSFLDYLNPEFLKVLTGCKIEPSLAGAAVGAHYQFERKGFFCVDPDSKPGSLVFNQTVSLRDSWAKIDVENKKGRSGQLNSTEIRKRLKKSASFLSEHYRGSAYFWEWRREDRFKFFLGEGFNLDETVGNRI